MDIEKKLNDASTTKEEKEKLDNKIKRINTAISIRPVGHNKFIKKILENVKKGCRVCISIQNLEDHEEWLENDNGRCNM